MRENLTSKEQKKELLIIMQRKYLKVIWGQLYR
jgi:hypothetical protein